MPDREDILPAGMPPPMPSDAMRLHQLERLVLSMSKTVVGPPEGFPEDMEIAAIIRDLRQRHPDV